MQYIWAAYGKLAAAASAKCVSHAMQLINLSVVHVLCLAGSAGVARRRLAGRVAAPAAAWRARALR